MAQLNRGDTGETNEVDLTICQPGITYDGFPNVASDIAIACSLQGHDNRKPGFPVYLTMTHDEALELVAQIAKRLQTPSEPARKVVKLEGGML